MSLAVAPARYIALIPLPEQACAQVEAWAEEAQGASVPAFGWHITLLPPFVAGVHEAVLVGAMDAALTGFAAFSVTLTAANIVPDKTRPGYAAVFLECADEAVDGCAAVSNLRDSLAQALDPFIHESLPALRDAPFRPHLTLALSVSEQEAQRLARFARSRKLFARFTCDRVRLLRPETTSDQAVVSWWHDLRLSSGTSKDAEQATQGDLLP